MTAAAGFLLASKGHIQAGRFVAALLGIAFVIASGCILNNYIDRGIDEKMERTKTRALVTGLISVSSAIIFAIVLSSLGFSLLALFVNALTVLLGINALVFYVVIYGFVKRRSVYGTLVGSIPGSMALVAGYTAVSGRLDGCAIILFFILAAWQMPHFYAIALFRQKDYANARLPVLPVVKGHHATKIQIMGFIILFILACILLALRGYAGLLFTIVMVGVGLRWLQLAAKGFSSKNDVVWARGLFGFSLIVLLIFSLMISIDYWIF